MRKPTWLWDHAKNVNSQCGEDGVVAQLLDLLPAADGWCVEFGASDGRSGSAACTLIEQRGYSAVLIEGNPLSFQRLMGVHGANPRVHAFNRFIGLGAADSIEATLRETAIPADFDFLCIDIDSCDYHVWDSVKSYRPKIVCIEFNPTIPNGVHFVQAPDFRVSHGNSLAALVELGKSKKYELACVTYVNAIFVTQELFPLLQIADNRPETLRLDYHPVTYVFTGYDGTVFSTGLQKLRWHDVPMRLPQTLPAFLRKYPPGYSLLQRMLFTLLFKPATAIPKLMRRLRRLPEKK